MRKVCLSGYTLRFSEDFFPSSLFSSYRIGVVSIAPAHPLLKPGTVIKEVDFQINYKLNRLDNKVSGKSKRGGQKVAETSPICVVHTSGEHEASYVLLAGMKGTLIEVNEKLSTQPSLIHERVSSRQLSNQRTVCSIKGTINFHLVSSQFSSALVGGLCSHHLTELKNF